MMTRTQCRLMPPLRRAGSFLVSLYGQYVRISVIELGTLGTHLIAAPEVWILAVQSGWNR